MERGASSELPRSVQIPILFFLPFLGCFHFWSFRVYSDFQQSCRDQHVYACPMPPPMTPHFPVARSVSVQSESEIVSHTNLSGFRRQWGFIDAVKSAAVTLFVLCCLFRVVFPAARRCHSHPSTSFGHLYSHLYSTCLFFSHQRIFFLGFIFLSVLLGIGNHRRSLSGLPSRPDGSCGPHLLETGTGHPISSLPSNLPVSDLAVLVDTYGSVTTGSKASVTSSPAHWHLVYLTRLVFPNTF